MNNLTGRNAWVRVDIPNVGVMFRRERSMPGSSILVEYRRPRPKVRRDRAEDLSPIPLAEEPLPESVCGA
jgi:hypothetical protein